jgi:DHA2 family multidrug resistance protein-like MFS transporter
MLVVTVYQLTLAMSLLPLSALGERFGYRRLYQTGLALHCTAGLLCLLVDSLPALILVRGMQSLAAATAMSVAVAMLRNIYPPRRLGSGLALNTIFNASGTALAPVVGGLIISVASWHWTFVAVAPLAAVALLLSRTLPDPVPNINPFDLRGAGLCALTFGLIIGGLEGAVHTSHLAASLATIAAGLVSGWFLVLHEKGELQPVLPVDLLAQPTLGLTALATFTGTLGSMVLILSTPFRLQHGHGIAPGEIGGLMAAYAMGSVLIAPLAGVLSDRVAVPLLCTIGMVLATAGAVFVALTPEQAGHFDIAWRLSMCGVGFGFFFSPNARFLVGSAPPTRTAAAGSLFTTSRMLAMATSATLVAVLLELDLGDGPVPALVVGFFSVISGLISASRWRYRQPLP